MFITQKSVKLHKYLSSPLVLKFPLCQGSRDSQVFRTTNSEGEKNVESSKNMKLPEEPQTCCMSGCSNCVWIAYAEELAKILNDGGDAARQKILDQIKDPNLRAFLLLELSHILKKKE